MSLDLAAIHHVAICVDDLDAALAFYIDVIGLTRAERPDSLPNPGAWLDLGEQQVHLLAGTDRGPGTFQHFSVEVESLAAAEASLAKHGIALEGHQVVEGYGRQAFVRDPSGNLLELFEQRWPLDDELTR
ncbi:MAG: lactoylglutathione lyase family protein [Actinomycetia bacterium]|nr:lactoylglutathione lyase family protein [Actinomycetes bacterium]